MVWVLVACAHYALARLHGGSFMILKFHQHYAARFGFRVVTQYYAVAHLAVGAVRAAPNGICRFVPPYFRPVTFADGHSAKHKFPQTFRCRCCGDVAHTLNGSVPNCKRDRSYHTPTSRTPKLRDYNLIRICSRFYSAANSLAPILDDAQPAAEIQFSAFAPNAIAVPPNDNLSCDFSCGALYHHRVS